jgi:hypothetical protein
MPDNASESIPPVPDQRVLPAPESDAKPPVEDLSIPANPP